MSNESKLGTPPSGPEGRDAVHIAIVAACAATGLTSGSPVRLNAQNEAEPCRVEEAVGVVDPFRSQDQRKLSKGTWFWLCLYPQTITGLRHVWEHPSFPVGDSLAVSTEDSGDVNASEQWIKEYVKEHCDYWNGLDDYGYSNFIGYVRDERWVYYYGSDCHGLDDVVDADELFKHLSVVLGKRINADYFESFTCSC